MSNNTSFDRAIGPWVIRWRWPVLVVSIVLAMVDASPYSANVDVC